MDTCNRIFEFKFNFALINGAGDRCCADRIWGTGKWDMTFTSEKTRSRIQADPSRAWNVDFGPGMQVGEIFLGP